MPAPLAKGLIVLAVVVVAAGAAAYENPQVREWVENSRKKIALALHSLGEEVNPRARKSRQSDASMREDEADAAEERRRRARAEIMEKGRIMEERRGRKQNARASPSPTGSFDTLVDKDGMLKKRVSAEGTRATSTAVDREIAVKGLTDRSTNSSVTKGLHQSVDAPLPLTQLTSHSDENPRGSFETQYERELRNTWNLPLLNGSPPASSAHESESLIDFTPTSEFPDPDVVIPVSGASYTRSLDQTDYFSISSNSSHTLSEAVAMSPPMVFPHLSQPPLQQQLHPQQQQAAMEGSSISSLASSIDYVNPSDAGSSVDGEGILSDFGDGIRTPQSEWTDVGSVISSDAGQ